VVVDAVSLAEPEPLEHMLVEAHADWTVVDVSTASSNAGSVLLSPRGRQFSAGHELGAAAAAVQTWRLEPSTSAPIALGSLPRRGARLATLTGVVSLAAASPSLLVPATPVWSAEVPAPPARPHPGRLRIAALNLHGYVVAGRLPGTRSELELGRQRDKLVAALRALDADVLALTELENAGSSGLEHLLEGLAAQAAGEPLVFLEAPSPGGSELRAGIAFRPGRVSSLGPAWFDTRAGFRRAPLFQSFETSAGSFTLGVVHFKSKLCGGEPEVVPAEGCGADTRRAEAELLLESLRGLRERRPLEPLLVMGDLNSDPLEAAVQALEAGGLVDLLGALPSADRYSFVYEARTSLLDHALGSPELAARAFGAIWHINADEPSFRDYSLDNPPELYVADARRCSDHDPVVLDLEF
jgi:predicted extracellular nuclease